MQLTCIHRLMVALLLLCFAALLPTHTHAAHPAELAAAANAGDGGQRSADHGPDDCPACRLSSSAGILPLDLLPLIVQAPVAFALLVDAERPAMVRIALPYHGRAPPLV